MYGHIPLVSNKVHILKISFPRLFPWGYGKGIIRTSIAILPGGHQPFYCMKNWQVQVRLEKKLIKWPN